MDGLGRDNRTQATAWLAPLPPGPVENEVPVKVSPPEGTRVVTFTRSVFKLPIIVIILGAILGECEGSSVVMLIL